MKKSNYCDFLKMTTKGSVVGKKFKFAPDRHWFYFPINFIIFTGYNKKHDCTLVWLWDAGFGSIMAEVFGMKGHEEGILITLKGKRTMDDIEQLTNNNNFIRLLSFMFWQNQIRYRHESPDTTEEDIQRLKTENIEYLDFIKGYNVAYL